MLQRAGDGARAPRPGGASADRQARAGDRQLLADGTREALLAECTGERLIPPTPSLLGAGYGELRVADGAGFTLVLQSRNRGKAASLKLGIGVARSDYVICQDADLEYDPGDIVSLLAHAERTGAAAVFGSRLGQGGRLGLDSFQWGRVGLTKLFCLLYRSRITDVATCYKLMRTEVVRSLLLRSANFDVDFEIAAELRRRGFAIDELPIHYAPRDRTHGKKIRWRDGWSAAWTFLRVRFR